jgi:dephospho-CoA kinase
MANSSKSKPIIGILGGIGAGKSVVAAQFVQLGCYLIDGDAIGHDVMRQDDVKELVRRQWGGGVFTPQGQIDRKALGRIIFNEQAGGQQLELLNQIMQPRIGERISMLIHQANELPDVPAIILDAAIMIEAGWDRFCSHFVFVSAPADIRASRVVSERGWDEQSWRQREKLQFSLDAKRQRCYFTVDNSSSMSCLYEQIREVLRQIVNNADRP